MCVASVRRRIISAGRDRGKPGKAYSRLGVGKMPCIHLCLLKLVDFSKISFRTVLPVALEILAASRTCNILKSSLVNDYGIGT